MVINLSKGGTCCCFRFRVCLGLWSPFSFEGESGMHVRWAPFQEETLPTFLNPQTLCQTEPLPEARALPLKPTDPMQNLAAPSHTNGLWLTAEGPLNPASLLMAGRICNYILCFLIIYYTKYTVIYPIKAKIL